jgi:hypothetical protein
LVLPENISLENLKRIRDEISARRSNYKKMAVTSAASSDEPPDRGASSPSPSTTSTSNPVIQRQLMVICFYTNVIPVSSDMSLHITKHCG